MNQTYQSCKRVLLLDFLRKLLWITPAVLLLIIFSQNMAKDREFLALHPDRLQTLYFVLALAAGYIILVSALAAYLSFFRLNITAQVTQDAVTLLRGKKAYVKLAASKYVFSSYVVKHHLILTYLERFLSAREISPIMQEVDSNSPVGFHQGFSQFFSKKRDQQYRLCLSKNDFEEFISVATSLHSNKE